MGASLTDGAGRLKRLVGLELLHETVWVQGRRRELEQRSNDVEPVPAEEWVELYAREREVLLAMDDVDRAEVAHEHERYWQEQLVGPLHRGSVRPGA